MRHVHHSRRWVVTRYWHPERGEWRFATPDGACRLNKHVHTRIQRHIVVKADRSPYDGDWIYWSTRLGKHPEVPLRVATFLKRQRGKCLECGLFFKDGDLLEADQEEREQDALQGDFIFEPEPEQILERLLPVYLETEIYRALLESAASFLGAQMTAMRNASKNAGELIDSLTLAMNRARQAEITQEILEVVAGADALAG